MVFSLYGHIFQERLHFSQFQVNGVAIGASVALYLPVSLLGYICDRVGTAPLSILAAVLFGSGYGLAAAVYRALEAEGLAMGHGKHKVAGWTYALMVFAFVCIGVGTCAMYLSAVATCAKNFGKGRHRGLALATPIAAFGLSGMWLSQVGSRLFTRTLPDGSEGDVDVFHFFIFLAVLLTVVGFLGVFTLRVVGEEDLIDEAAEEMERSGLLDTGSLSGRRSTSQGYGTVEDGEDTADDDDAKWKKKLVLNTETKQFLTDRTMWLLALGFLLMIGPGEAFINNLGTVIATLNPPNANPPNANIRSPTSPATHVSIVGITNTVARLLTGTLTDWLAPSPATQHAQVTSRPFLSTSFTVSRVVFLLGSAVILSIGLASLASGAMQNHGERFWIVSGLVGAGYGAVFSLTPIIITVIWGVENFATNWGIVAMFPALGATFWGLIYSAVYEHGAENTGEEDAFCYGQQCYAPTFWAMTVSVWVACLLIAFAWKGTKGWAQRGIVI